MMCDYIYKNLRLYMYIFYIKKIIPFCDSSPNIYKMLYQLINCRNNVII